MHLAYRIKLFACLYSGTDISEQQIKQAKLLSDGMDIQYYVQSAENTDFPDNTGADSPACFHSAVPAFGCEGNGQWVFFVKSKLKMGKVAFWDGYGAGRFDGALAILKKK